MVDQKQLLIELQEYVEFHLHHDSIFAAQDIEAEEKIYSEAIVQHELEDFIKSNRQPTLNQMLFSFIDQKGISDVDIYKKAGIDRRHFSKIRSNENYRPGKNTIIALAFSLELNEEDAERLLATAGYSLSDSDTQDLIIQFFLEKEIYDIDLVNLALDNFNLKPLTGNR
ncbi:hypothetical protein [Salinibacillus xinjiangensis]|uniref:XRE family transcriptional regulator n=1 Tax=Salinibacillus xinjiangensis TaxID=1229268 RepID=A0A6G1X8F4_9BACI|nr:hypothetical protein [Salinibacillus xinjiangensis]MRG87185.1 hypothetical protein [Salinibacillus xinjiangensis]